MAVTQNELDVFDLRSGPATGRSSARLSAPVPETVGRPQRHAEPHVRARRRGLPRLLRWQGPAPLDLGSQPHSGEGVPTPVSGSR